MKTKHYIAVDIKETNEKGEKLLLPITPPYETLRELGDALGMYSIRYLYKLVNNEIKNPKSHIGIEIVYLTKERK